jgi:hypothetical protein
MRHFVFVAAAALAACASTPAARESIEVVYQLNGMEYSIEDGGAARIAGADAERVLEFQASHEDYRRIADLLAPLQNEGLACDRPPQNARPGSIVWRRGAEEARRVEMHVACGSGGDRPLAANVDGAWRAMAEMARTRALVSAIADPAIIAVERMYWGNPTSSWSVSRTGEGRYNAADRTQTFTVSREQFEQIREIFRPYEGRYFQCERVIADGPYGDIVWFSREGQEDRRTRFDAGCVTGDAADLFDRLDRAETLIEQLRADAP